MHGAGLYFGWGTLLQIAAIVHWARRRPATFWLWIILFGGAIGSLAYFLIEGINYDALGRSVHGPSRRRRIRELRLLVRDNPSAGNYEELGELLLTERKYAEAKEAFDAALAQRNDSIDPFYRRGIAELELGDNEAAVRDFEHVVKHEPKYDYSRALCLLAQALARSGRVAEAQTAFDRLVQSSTSAESRVAAAEFYADHGQADQARKLVEDLLARRATMPAFQKRRDRAFLRRASKLLRRLNLNAKAAA